VSGVVVAPILGTIDPYAGRVGAAVGTMTVAASVFGASTATE